jgi:gamma-glutamylcyclotransferase
MSASRLYFAYGSNLWVKQMEERCPNSIKVCIAKLPGYLWDISSRGFANVYRDENHVVYGVLYALSKSDEDSLDRFEGVPSSYEKVYLDVEVHPNTRKVHHVLTYIDPRKGGGSARQEYVTRIRDGLNDAKLPYDWVRTNIEPVLGRQASAGVQPRNLEGEGREEDDSA